jgi:hypothetical protein
MAEARDFAGAKIVTARLKAEGRLNEASVLGLAKQKKYEATITVLAELSQTSIELVRPLMQSLRSDGILVPCKVAGLGWETVSAILDCRFSTGVTAPDELARLKGQFIGLTAESAERTLRLWTVRASTSSSQH